MGGNRRRRSSRCQVKFVAIKKQGFPVSSSVGSRKNVIISASDPVSSVQKNLQGKNKTKMLLMLSNISPDRVAHLLGRSQGTEP